MLRPVIIIGCGGSGQKTVRYLRDAVRRRLIHAGWRHEIPQAWQFLAIDRVNTQEDASIPYLPNNDYVSFALNFNNFQQLDNAIGAKFGPEGIRDAFMDLQGWRPNPTQVQVPLPGPSPFGFRAVSRLGMVLCQDLVKTRLKFAFSQCSAGGPELTEVSRHLGVEAPPGMPVPPPLVFVIGSMAGGTGAGIMLDVIDLVRRSHQNGAFPILVAFTPDIFGAIRTHTMTANSAAFMSELLSAYWDNKNTDSSLIPAEVAVNTRGPHSTFLIGRTNIDGVDLEDSNNVYRAVGEILAAISTSLRVQANFFQSAVSSWQIHAPANAGGLGFFDAELPGVVSSFGCATIAIGRERFSDYLQKLLHRSILEQLAHGYEVVASNVLGESAGLSMAAAAKISELARRNVDLYLHDCGLSETISGIQQVSDKVVSDEIVRFRAGEFEQQIRSVLPVGQQMSGAMWKRSILSKSKEIYDLSDAQSANDLDGEIQQWGNEILQSILQATTDHAASLSIPVVLDMVEIGKSRVLESAQQLRDQARENFELARQHEQLAHEHLGDHSSGNIGLSHDSVSNTMNEMAQSLAMEWASDVREKLAVALESVAHSMLSSVEAGLRQSLSRIGTLVTPQDGKPAIIAGWPKNNGVVPPSFAPSPVEFFLEPYEEWPSQAKELLGKSLGEKTGLPLDPVEAARTLIIRGGFTEEGSESVAPPLVWASSHGSEPEWEAGQPVAVKVFDGLEDLADRIEAWLKRPSTDLNYILNEGLGDYLQAIHPKTKAPIANHDERLARFRQMLQTALMQSQPLVEIDVAMNATVHSMDLKYDLNIQGFPFGVGHPARHDTEQIIQGFLKTATNVDWAFSSTEAESVLLTSFLQHPVNPSVVSSFTQPLNSALQSFGPNPALLRSSFWQWRRARILENFVPLPDRLRHAAVRGFAVARATGLITANTTEQNRISTEKGVFSFPPHMLTEFDRDNTLAVLLEAMILAFGDAPTRGKAAFDAYGAMIELGVGGGATAGFAVDGLFERILRDGDYGAAKVVDQVRADAIKGSSPEERAAKVEQYLLANLERFETLAAETLNPRSWRNAVGSVEPVDTMTKELLTDLRTSYTEVLQAVRKAKMGGSVT